MGFILIFVICKVLVYVLYFFFLYDKIYLVLLLLFFIKIDK